MNIKSSKALNVPRRDIVRFPLTQAGGRVIACQLDDACVQVDCDELAGVSDTSPDASEYVRHYCGVDYLGNAVMPRKK